VVAPGDSLWAIAERSLHNNDDLDDLDDLAVERRWRAIYRANREVIGADPDLIVPGQRLVLPVPPPGKP
jgi:nucleoid-associated protein YgaU